MPKHEQDLVHLICVISIWDGILGVIFTLFGCLLSHMLSALLSLRSVTRLLFVQASLLHLSIYEIIFADFVPLLTMGIFMGQFTTLFLFCASLRCSGDILFLLQYGMVYGILRVPQTHLPRHTMLGTTLNSIWGRNQESLLFWGSPKHTSGFYYIISISDNQF